MCNTGTTGTSGCKGPITKKTYSPMKKQMKGAAEIKSKAIQKKQGRQKKG